MAPFWEDIKEKATWAAEQLGEKLEEATEAGKTEFEVLKVRRQIDALEDEVMELYKQLGKRAFELFEDGRLDDAECKGIGDDIQGKKTKAEELGASIDALREKHEAFLRQREDESERKSRESDERRKDKEEGIDGEAVWEDDDRDDGTPPPP